MDYSRENVVHVIQTNGPDNWVPNSSDPSVWATEEDYRAWYNQETPTDTPSNSSHDQRQPQSLFEQPPSKKPRNPQDSSSNSRSRAIGKMFFKTKLCCKFKAGTCLYISNCNFAHSAEELRCPLPNWQEIVVAHKEEKVVSSELSPREEFQIPCLGSTSFVGETLRSYKGRHCQKFYSEEGCPYGDSCTFLHDEQSKNRESIAISLGPRGCGGGGSGSAGGNGSNMKSTNWKTMSCNKWELTGYCTFGNKCHFAHGAAGPISTSIFNMSSLNVIDLSHNNLSDGLHDDLCHHLPKIEVLYLAMNELSGTIPPSIDKCSYLQILVLFANKFSGIIPRSIWNLTQLNELYLWGNNLQGPISTSIFNMSSLNVIDLSHNNLSDGLHDDLCHHLPKIEVLHLHINELFGNIPPSIGKCSHLQLLALSINKFSGIIPTSIGNLTRLQDLYLGFNNLQGQIPSSVFNISSLKFISLSNNSLSDNLPDDLCHHLLKLEALYLHTSDLYGSIPSSIGECYNLQFLDLSANQFSGLIPIDLFNSTKLKEQVPGKHLSTLNRRLNPLHFFMSENDLMGEIPSTICNLSSLALIDLSMNKLDGVIPSCLGNFSSLSIVDLRMNKFVGKIPPIYHEFGRLRSLNLNGNQLEGSIPTSLGNCKSLEVLDLGNNNLNDSFPYWLGRLPNLQVLVLQSNRFHGEIQDFNVTFSFSSLRLIDLSQNEFTGRIPPALFDNLKAMRDIQENKTSPSYMGESFYYRYSIISYYNDTITVTLKGMEMKLKRILTDFTIMDFSCNHFQGSIPEAVGELNSLIVLNFSHNSLTGNIPPSLGKLTALESLDLSSNKLQGRIPKQLTELTFLGALSLSHNNLEGPIPLANHLDTFSNDSFSGNPGLCGFPLSKKCGDDVGSESPPSTVAEHNDSETTLFWKIAAVGYGCGLMFGFSMGHIVFTTERPRWLVKMISRNPHKRTRTRIHRNGGRRN